MRTCFLLIGAVIISCNQLAAQRTCVSADYFHQALQKNPSLAGQLHNIEDFIQQRLASTPNSRVETVVIKIPVVVHILYHLPDENIDDEKIFSQIDLLNKCFRRTNGDTVNTPAVFKSRAADCGIEFQLAISDPNRRSTTGIIRKYTPITYWYADDQMKYSAQMGDDGWDPKSYLNIWVCNLRKVAGYSSVPGDAPEKDGLVIDYTVFGPNASAGYEQGKTAVHETGHWLNLKHIWGDANCGNDFVDDTPTQSDYNVGCPSGIRISCNNAPYGDMYTNYMDYTNDACINIFTEGQKARMRTLFAPGGARYAILSSYGLTAPLVNEAPLPEQPPKWLHPQVYPNPATNELILDVSYDVRWIGRIILVTDVNGHRLMQVQISSREQHIDVSRLRPGIYFISIKKEDGSYIKQKFIKM